MGKCIWLHIFQTQSFWKSVCKNKQVFLATENMIEVQWSMLKYTWDKTVKFHLWQFFLPFLKV